MQESNKNTKYVLAISMKYEQLHISAEITEIKTVEILTTNNIQITAKLPTPVYKI